MRINTNMAALNAWRNLTINNENMQKSLQKLSSGYRINRAADDAAGLAVSEKMRSQIRGLNQAVRNAQDGIGLLQTAEGGASVIQDMLQRMRELANQASSGTLQNSDRSQLDQEFQQLKQEVDRIAQSTQFNNQNLLTGGLAASVGNLGANLTPANGIVSITSNGKVIGNGLTLTVDTAANTATVAYTDALGNAVSETVNYTAEPVGTNQKVISFQSTGIQVTVNSSLADINAGNTFDVTGGTAAIQVGANNGQTMNITIADMQAAALGIAGLDLTTAANASAAMSTLDTAIGTVSTQRAVIGAYQNRLENTISNLQSTSENLTAAESRIRDVDMAQEMATFTKYNILQQASTAMLAQANQSTQGILSLLR